MSKNTERTLKHARGLGYDCWMAERFLRFPPPGRRVDLFNIIDIVAISHDSTVGIQSCGSDFAAHKTKILENEYSYKWVRCPERELWLIGWRKLLKKRGGKQRVWRPRIGYFEVSGHGRICMVEKQ